MKSFFNKLGVHRMDEMETSIVLKAQRIALTYVTATLFIWNMYEFYKTYTYEAKLNILPFFLLLSTTWILNISQVILMKRTVKDDSDYLKENRQWGLVLLLLLIIGMIIAFGSFLILSGV